MKKIINGKRYDTDTARLVGTWHNGEYSFDSVEEKLYKKKNGSFFLHGTGGANTRYADMIDSNSWSGGEKIIPLSYEEARQWSEDHLTVDEYEAIFGEIQEDDTVITIALTQKVATVEKAKRVAAQRGTTLSAYIADLILADVEGKK